MPEYEYKPLEIENTLFLFLDHQAGLITLVRDFDPDVFYNNVLGLVRVANFFKIPSILSTSMDKGPNGPIVKELRERLPDAKLVRRPGEINAMDNPDIVKLVRDSGKKQIVISGVLTEVCVVFPALTLASQGYQVYVAIDASGTFSDATREAAHKRLAQAGVQLANWPAIASELQRDWRRDEAGFGSIWADFIPGYRALIQHHENGQNNAK